jgi:hypothetical protein
MKLTLSASILLLAAAGMLQAQQASPSPASLGELTKQQVAKFKAVSPEEAKALFEEAIKAVQPGSDVTAAGIVAGAIKANPKGIAEVVESATRLQPMLAPVTVATAVGVNPGQASKVVEAARAGVRRSPIGQVSAPKAGGEAKVVGTAVQKPTASVATLNAAITGASRAASKNGEVSGWLWGMKGRPASVVRPIDALNQAAAGLPVLHAIDGEEGGGTPVDPGGGEESGGGAVSNNIP